MSTTKPLTLTQVQILIFSYITVQNYSTLYGFFRFLLRFGKNFVTVQMSASETECHENCTSGSYTSRGSNRDRGDTFGPFPEWQWGPPSLYIQGVKRQRGGVNNPPHLPPKLKKEYSYTYTRSLSFHGLL